MRGISLVVICIVSLEIYDLIAKNLLNINNLFSKSKKSYVILKFELDRNVSLMM